VESLLHSRSYSDLSSNASSAVSAPYLCALSAHSNILDKATRRGSVTTAGCPHLIVRMIYSGIDRRKMIQINAVRIGHVRVQTSKPPVQ
jgi:hypothetical protein